jgi:hypothetical protein
MPAAWPAGAVTAGVGRLRASGGPWGFGRPGRGHVLAALDIAEVAQHAQPPVGVLDEELVPAVLQSQHPAAGFDNERGGTGAGIEGGAVLCDGEPEGFVDGLLVRFLGPACRVHSCPDRNIGADLRVDGRSGGGSQEPCAAEAAEVAVPPS